MATLQQRNGMMELIKQRSYSVVGDTDLLQTRMANGTKNKRRLLSFFWFKERPCLVTHVNTDSNESDDELPKQNDKDSVNHVSEGSNNSKPQKPYRHHWNIFRVRLQNDFNPFRKRREANKNGIVAPIKVAAPKCEKQKEESRLDAVAKETTVLAEKKEEQISKQNCEVSDTVIISPLPMPSVYPEHESKTETELATVCLFPMPSKSTSASEHPDMDGNMEGDAKNLSITGEQHCAQLVTQSSKMADVEDEDVEDEELENDDENPAALGVAFSHPASQSDKPADEPSSLGVQSSHPNWKRRGTDYVWQLVESDPLDGDVTDLPSPTNVKRTSANWKSNASMSYQGDMYHETDMDFFAAFWESGIYMPCKEIAHDLVYCGDERDATDNDDYPAPLNEVAVYQERQRLYPDLMMISTISDSDLSFSESPPDQPEPAISAMSNLSHVSGRLVGRVLV